VLSPLIRNRPHRSGSEQLGGSLAVRRAQHDLRPVALDQPVQLRVSPRCGPYQWKKPSIGLEVCPRRSTCTSTLGVHRTARSLARRSRRRRAPLRPGCPVSASVPVFGAGPGFPAPAAGLGVGSPSDCRPEAPKAPRRAHGQCVEALGSRKPSTRGYGVEHVGVGADQDPGPLALHAPQDGLGRVLRGWSLASREEVGGRAALTVLPSGARAVPWRCSSGSRRGAPQLTPTRRLSSSISWRSASVKPRHRELGGVCRRSAWAPRRSRKTLEMFTRCPFAGGDQVRQERLGAVHHAPEVDPRRSSPCPRRTSPRRCPSGRRPALFTTRLTRPNSGDDLLGVRRHGGPGRTTFELVALRLRAGPSRQCAAGVRDGHRVDVRDGPAGHPARPSSMASARPRSRTPPP